MLPSAQSSTSKSNGWFQRGMKRESMLPSAQSTTSKSNGWFQRCIESGHGASTRLKMLNSKVIRFIHARDFLAEFLATFVLVVSLLPHMIIKYIWMCVARKCSHRCSTMTCMQICTGL